MKKVIILLMLLGISVQIFSETLVKGTYEKKKKRYRELSLKVIGNIKLNSISGDRRNSLVLKTDNYDIIVDKNELISLYNGDRRDKLSKLKNTLTYKEAGKHNLKNEIAELIESGKGVIYDKKNKTELKNIVKVKYSNKIYYDEGRGSEYEGYTFYADNDFEKRIMDFDVVVPGLGVMIHSSIGDNPYMKIIENKNRFEKYNEKKELYEKAKASPDNTFTIKY
ncbi:MAG: hypothetical protein Q4D53_03295 [Leptotrichiaceae bacterium]|nr:hypothetical protein [Leptotrichiaceae bacterium]